MKVTSIDESGGLTIVSAPDEHEPTNGPDNPRCCPGLGRLRRAGIVAATFLVVAAACGGSDDSSGHVDGTAVDTGTASIATPAVDTETASSAMPATTEAAPTTEPAPTATPEPSAGPLPVAEWAEAMRTAWTTYLTAKIEGLVAVDGARRQGIHFFDAMRSLVAIDLEALEAYAAALDVQADDPAIDASADPMRAVIANKVTVARTVHDLAEQDPDRVRQEIDDAEAASPGSLPDTPWGDAFTTYNDDDSAARQEAACFDLQDAIHAAGHGLVDCVGSSIDVPTAGDLLEPGVHELSVFTPGLTLDLARPTVVLEAGDFVEVKDADSPVSAEFLAIDEVVDPTGLADPESQPTMPIPDDLAPWLAQFPVMVLAEGTVDTATGPAQYWDLQIDEERASELAPGSFFIELARYAVNDSFGSYGFIGGAQGPDQHFIIVDWRRGVDRILVYGIDDSLDQELFEWVQEMLTAAS